MKSKIFKRSILALMALLAINTISFAQQTPAPPVPVPVLPPIPPVAPLNQMTAPDSKDFQLKMNDLHIKMKDLQKQISHIKLQQLKQMNLKMKGFDKQFKHLDQNFNYQLNDSTRNLACDLSNNIAPQIALGFKDFDTNFSYNTDNDSQHDDGVEKVKNYSKSYSIDGNDVINLDNRFGKITVNTWNKSEVKVDVQIKVGANDDDMAQKLLDNVTIRDSKDGSGVYFKTNINSDDNGSSWSLFGGRRNNVRKIEVNYTVYMPSRNPLNVSNKYGATSLPDLDGKLVINNSYGSLVAKVLSNPGNQITVKYGSATIGSLNGSDLDVAYGSLNLGECNKLNADISYSSAKIGRLTTSGNINVKFSGNLNINEVDKNVKNLAVNSSYSSVKLGISNEQNADFDVTVRYGSFNYGGHDINITSKSPADNDRGYNPTKNYKGHLGKGSNDKTITINTSYGSVSFD
ncbi:hypothetical protein HDF23_005582 [Mucilaginibacter lappiensis]|uniref:Adhesin domain-containing protein n=1 Tax=Mucilaginibacter lappiensis TaxID=354630 RepID=A0ABR6PUG1_9SPHI|nr:hypothetical protein [Mucilaginibacter lappiensis]MBB6112799.1 hypothetical protein [Mucilaginibacter lappiensis]